MIENKINLLLEKYYDGSITSVEKQQLFSLILTLQDDELEELLYKHFLVSDSLDLEDKIDYSKIWNELDEYIYNNVNSSKIKKLNWKKFSLIAASLITILSIGLIILNYSLKDILESEHQNYVGMDVPPGGNKAILTLTDGSKINLDTLSIGNVIFDNHTIIKKLENGQIIYQTKNNLANSSKQNIIETPAGGTFQVVLPDGSKVWLNANSRLKYPLDFKKTVREVELKGEGYFEIQSNKAAPFFVHISQNKSIKVLGTKFNINAYDIRTAVTSVAEGSVNVSNDQESKLLLKNQAVQFQNSSLIFYENRNVMEDVAWIDGYFCKESSSLKNILEQISKWYDVKIHNPENIDLEFVISLKKDMYLNDLIKIIELTNKVKLNFRNNVIYVTKAD